MGSPASLGWWPFSAFSVLILLFSWFFILYHRSVREGEKCGWTSIMATLSLTTTLLSAALVPVDIYVVSAMKNSTGDFEDWAKNPEDREAYLKDILIAYYVFFSLILAFGFIILPLCFFYHAAAPLDEDREDLEDAAGESTGQKCCRAFKYTSASVLLLLILVLLGIFLPFEGSPPVLLGAKEELTYAWESFKANEGFDLIAFLLNTVSSVGLFLLILYTGYGMSSWPFHLICGSASVHNELAIVEAQMLTIEVRLGELRNQEGPLGEFEIQEVERLEREKRILARSKHELEQATKNCTNRCLMVLRPFQVIFGLFFGLMGMLVFVSLFLTNLDKSLHSSGAKSGYALRNGTLPNPTDKMLVFAQEVFPLDYILYGGLVFFFVISSINGVKDVGIRFMWLPLYKIKANATKPQALALMALTLSLILVALNVILFTIAPDYTTYGSQKYATTHGNDTKMIEHCDDAHAPAGDCNMTRISLLLMSFHTKAWIFGALYYWLTWLFLLVIFCGSFVAIYRTCKMRRGGRSAASDDDEDELLDDDSNPTVS